MSESEQQNKVKTKRRELSQDKIVEAALRILTTEDESALSMRRVAKECGVSAMALYHHVEDKDQLAELAVDRIFHDVAMEMADWQGGARAGALHLMSTLRKRLIDVPGAGTIFVRRAIVAKGTALTTEAMFRSLNGCGLHGKALAQTADSFAMLLIGSIANELTRPARIRDGLIQQVPDTETPILNENIEAYSDRDGAALFEQALGWIIDAALKSQSA